MAQVGMCRTGLTVTQQLPLVESLQPAKCEHKFVSELQASSLIYSASKKAIYLLYYC